MANLLHCFHSVVMSLSSARFIPVTSWVSAHLSGGSLVRGSLVRGSLVRGFQGSLVRRFTCPGIHLFGVHLSVLFVCYNFLVPVRHSQGPPLPECAIRFDI